MNWGNAAGNTASGAMTGFQVGGPWGAAIGGGGGFLGSLLGGQQDPYKQAEKAANRGYDESNKYLQPYNQQGMDQYGRLNQATGDLMDPSKLESQWSSGYETSPYAKSMLGQNTEQGLDAASSMGLMGSSGALANIQKGAGDIVSKDRRDYMNDLMQKYLAGIGLGQNLYGTGASAAGQQSQQALQHGNDMAGLEYGRTQSPRSQFSSLLGQAGQLANMGENYFNQSGNGPIAHDPSVYAGFGAR